MKHFVKKSFRFIYKRHLKRENIFLKKHGFRLSCLKRIQSTFCVKEYFMQIKNHLRQAFFNIEVTTNLTAQDIKK